MNNSEQAPTAGATATRYPSLRALREEHAGLLRRRSFSEGQPEFLAEVETFLERAQGTGALLESFDDRDAAQSLLDYWANILQRTGRELPDPTLARFDPVDLELQDARELGDELYPYQNHRLLLVRQELIDQCLTRLHQQRLLVVAGPAGSGRSTSVRVGLLPVLQARALPGSDGFKCVTIAPGSDPSAGLVRLRELTDKANREPTICIVDHFEHLFVRWDERQRQIFIEQILGLVEKPEATHIVILIVRSDFLTYAASVKTLQPWFDRGVVRVKPFDARELREVIEKPATAIGLNFEAGLVEQLVEDVLGDPAALALLQFALQKLWEKRKRNWITWDAYCAVGGAHVLERSLEDFYQRLSLGEQAIVKRILLRLVRPSVGREITTQNIPQSLLYEPGAAHDQVDDLLKGLMHLGFVRLVKDETSSDLQVAVTCESLTFHWPRLMDWLSEERDAQRRRLRLTDAAKAWRDRGKDPDALWRGVLLQEASESTDLTELEFEFVQASQAAATRAARRQRQLIGAGVAALATIAGLIIFLLWVQLRQQRQVQVHMRVAQAMRAADEGDLVSSVPWLLWAVKEDSKGREFHRIRLGTVLRQRPKLSHLWIHSEQVNYAEVSADGSRVVTACDDGIARVWDAAAGGEPKELRHAAAVYHASFSPDGTRIVTASSDHTARLWDAAMGTETQRPLEHTDEVTRGWFNSRGNHVVTISTDWTARIWDAATGKEISEQPLQHDGEVNSASFSPDCTRVVTASSDGKARLWDAATGEKIAELEHMDKVNQAAFSPDGVLIITASKDGTAKLWSASSGSEIKTKTELKHEGGVNTAAFSGDGGRIVTAGEDARATVWRLPTEGREAAIAQGWLVLEWGGALRHASSVLDASFSGKDGQWLVTGSRDQTARVWDIRVTPARPLTPPLKHRGSVTHVSFDAMAFRVVTTSNYQEPTDDVTDGDTPITGEVRVWDLETCEPAVWPATKDISAKLVSFSTDGTRALAVDDDQKAHLWDTVTGKALWSPPLELDGVATHAALNHDGSRIAILIGENVHISDYGQTPTVPGDSFSVGKSVTHLSLSHDGNRLVTAHELEKRKGEARVWDMTGKQIAVVRHNETVTHASISPDGKWLLTASEDDTARLWDISTGKPVIGRSSGRPVIMNHSADVLHASFSPDGRRVLTGSVDQGARIWNADTGKPLSPNMRHSLAVIAAAVDPGGRLVVTVGEDRTARVWNAENGEPLTPLLRHADPTRRDALIDASFNRDGSRLFTHGREPEGTMRVRVWDVAPDDRDVEELRPLAELVTAHRLDDSGVLVPLDTEELKTRWESARSK